MLVDEFLHQTTVIPVAQVLAQIASGQFAVEALVLRESNNELSPRFPNS